ncbi:DinB family protein [Cellulomonas wangsupingiae]|uniref:DinB family protein n=1 Tax=Cellulomonas wangsupingiae TaxID=2968085 RepID=A0ABY5K6I3_9CELL|nr:DinB family protein [Cellulomonas wangsupingiae]MCC2334284.1 DinB family protein [Cellulomonas wangsupingiae]UUI65960.1 DinB family protein [Cellulomonas wangsupingiae]
MTAAPTQKQVLHRYLREARSDLVGKLEGLDDYDVRRPLVPTGTNLLGLVKHVASVQLDYLGVVFGRPSPRGPVPWFEADAAPESDMYAAEDETRADVLSLWQHSCAHADATVEALPLDAPGHVPWWGPQKADVSLHTVLVHLLSEVTRHAGHADVLRETVDGVAGMRAGDANLGVRTAAEWAAHREHLERVARATSATG